jgi:outer membrane receptor protein involved in Fe transport
MVPYIEADKSALSPLLEHERGKVWRWVKDHIAYIDRRIEYEPGRNDEKN